MNKKERIELGGKIGTHFSNGNFTGKHAQGDIIDQLLALTPLQLECFREGKKEVTKSDGEPKNLFKQNGMESAGEVEIDLEGEV